MRLDALAERWERAVDAFLAGRPLPADLEEWRVEGYRGAGAGAVDDQALPEPYLGDLRGRPRAAF
ncbi:MAG: hypothetical protein M3N16_00405 [Actinomycetota bacterium]|nr:hypothetical protein [Actinomycetota bacterium]